LKIETLKEYLYKNNYYQTIINQMADIKRPFNIEQLTLVGIRQNVYPTIICKICRGKLTDVCVECENKDLTHKIDCKVQKNKNDYYHKHCLDNSKISK
jgi:hypothetical protein